MMVSCQGMLGCISRPQLKVSSTTTAFGMPRALSRRSNERSSRELPARGRIGPVDAVAVELSRRDVVKIAVPDVLGTLRQFEALELAAALAVEQAKLDLFRVGGEQREIG